MAPQDCTDVRKLVHITLNLSHVRGQEVHEHVFCAHTTHMLYTRPFEICCVNGLDKQLMSGLFLQMTSLSVTCQMPESATRNAPPRNKGPALTPLPPLCPNITVDES